MSPSNLIEQPGPPIDDPPLTRGDGVWLITDSGREIVAVVQMASKNGRSLMLLFDALVGGWARQMPVFQEDDGSWKALDGMPITLRKAGEMKWTLPPEPAGFAQPLAGPQRSITCPFCGAVSYNPNDIANKYCGACKRFQEPERP